MRRLLAVALVVGSVGLCVVQAASLTDSIVYLPAIQHIPTPTPVPAGVHITGLVFTNGSQMCAVGEVLNNTDTYITVDAVYTFVKNGGVTVRTNSAAYVMSPIPPRRKSPWRQLLGGAVAWGSASFEIDYHVAQYAYSWFPTTRTRLELDTEGHLRAIGTVNNDTSLGSNSWLIAALYDPMGGVIGVSEERPPRPAYLSPGQTGTFDLEVRYWLGKPEQGRITGWYAVAFGSLIR